MIDYSLALVSMVDKIVPKRRTVAAISKAASFRMFLHLLCSTLLKQAKRGTKIAPLFLSAVNIQIIDLIGLSLRFQHEAVTFDSFVCS